MGKLVAVMQTALPNRKTVNPAQTLESPATFARYVGVTSQCVRNWCNDGTIPLRIRAGRVIRFEREAALAALSSKGGAA
jgi:hypothetical protein